MTSFQLFQAFGVSEDVNKKGLRKAKKGVSFDVPGGGKGVQYEQQDANCVHYPFGKNSKLALFCVFDGHAGAQCARRATEVFPRVFRKLLRAETKKRRVYDMAQVFRDAYAKTDLKLANFQYEGCTATTAVIWSIQGKRYLQCANVGDSAAFLCRGGEAVALSVDHKASAPEERERLLEAGIELSQHSTRLSGLAVSRALGDYFLKTENTGLISEPYVSEVVQLGAQDSYLVLASDGLWDTISGQSAMNVVMASSHRSPQKLAEKLLRQAVHSPKCTDNVTVQVVALAHPMEEEEGEEDDEADDDDERD